MPLTRRVIGFLGLATRIDSDPHDSSEETLRKALLVAISLMVLPAGVLWGTLYCVFDERVAAFIPWGYDVLSVASLLVFGLTRSFRFLRAAELLLILVAPFLLLLVLGGVTASSGVILGRSSHRSARSRSVRPASRGGGSRRSPRFSRRAFRSRPSCARHPSRFRMTSSSPSGP